MIEIATIPFENTTLWAPRISTGLGKNIHTAVKFKTEERTAAPLDLESNITWMTTAKN
jgi:hypothetical protein